MKNQTRVEKFKNWVMDHKLGSILIIVSLIVISLGSVTGAFNNIYNFVKIFSGESQDNEIPHKVASPDLKATINKSNRKTSEENMENDKLPKLWITYAWKDNEGGNFDFLVQKLEKAGINTNFDKVALVPGQRLWEQIAERIEDSNLDGWAILLTKDSIENEACKEELAYALYRTLNSKGEKFPLIGLIHQVPVDNVPASLRVRLMIDLRNPDWPQQVQAGLKKVPPKKTEKMTTKYIWEAFPDIRGSGTLAIYIRPRFEEIHYWRIICSENANCIDWGMGPPPKEAVSKVLIMSISGQVALQGKPGTPDEMIIYVGAENALTPSYGCYIIFGDPLPDFVAFGIADKDFDPPNIQTLEVSPFHQK